MVKIPDPVLIFYIIASVLGFFLRFIKDGVFKQLSFKPLLDRLGLFSLVLGPFIGLLLVSQHFASAVPAAEDGTNIALAMGNTLPFFAGAAGLSYLLSGMGLPSYLRGILLGGASVALTSLVPTDFIALSSVLMGLLVAKFTENFGYGTESSLDDIVPPFTWLCSIMFLSSAESEKDIPMRAAVILGIMGVSTLMRFLQGPFLFVGKTADDKIFVKRVVLSITAGLGVLCVIIKLLNLVHFQSLALICGAGYFITYMYKDLIGDERYSLAGMQGLRLLVFIGLLTMVAMRFYGTFGLLALGATGLVAPMSSAALFPAIYCVSRALLQVYLQHFNMNVTGINLTHPASGAAQYAGFLVGIAMLFLLREKLNRRVLLWLVLGTCIVTPVLSGFLLHSEPTCSLFASVLVSSFLLCVLGPALQNSASNGAENLCLAPALMISSGILTSGLLEMGNNATNAVKGTVLSYGVIFVLLMTFIFWFFFQRKQQTPATPPATADGA